jgi:1-acyl-sn-glycerol-3-phosphate acyltransferase
MTAAPALPLAGAFDIRKESIVSQALRHILAGIIVSAARIVTGAEARWIGCTPSDNRRIYVANHTSHADFILRWAALTPRLRSRTLPVAAAGYWNSSSLRRYLARQVFRAVLIERDHIDRTHNPLAPMVQALDSGNSLIVFPEGTRGNGETLQPFKCGIYHLASARSDVELVPVWIDNAYRILPRGAILPAPLRCSVTFGEPTHPGQGEDKYGFLGRLHRTIERLGASCATNR